MPIPARSPDTDTSIERAAFARYLRTGRRAAPLELKYNHNHDPADGRFTFADAGGGGASGVAPTTRRKTPAAGGTSEEGPFRSAAHRRDEVGTMARGVNAFVHGRTRQLVVPLGCKDRTVTVTRVEGPVVQLDHPNFTVRGRLSVTPGKEDIVIALDRPTIKLGLPVASYPTHLRLFQSVSGNINYSVDKYLKIGFGRVSSTQIRKGTYTRYVTR